MVSVRHVVHPQADEVAASQLAVDRSLILHLVAAGGYRGSDRVPVCGLDAVLGDEKPSVEQIVFRTGGMSNLAHAVAMRVAVLTALPGRVA